MANQNDIQGQIRVGVVNRGFKGDTPSDHSLNHGVRDINAGEDVNNADCGFWPLSSNPSQSNACQFGGGMDPAQLVYYIKNAGQTGGIILGLANAIENGGSGGGGGGQSLLNGAIQELMRTTIDVNIPPQIQESTARGAKVRTIKEKGTQHSLSVLDGLPLHGALFDMSGFRLPGLPNIPTARQTNDQMMTQNMLSQLPGQIMSLAQMFQGLMKNGSGGGTGGATAALAGGLGTGNSYWQDIHNVLTPNMSSALTSLSNLIQGHETDNGVAYVTGNVVHYGVYLENAALLLSKVQSIDDLMSVLSRLQWDTSIMGLDQLSNVVIQIENAWGTALQEINYNGDVTVTYANSNAQSEFANSMIDTT